VQFEVIMLDPYIRTSLTPKDLESATRYSATLKLPDVYGVFTFKVNYRRPGVTYVEHRDVLPLRPYRHNEYDRFLVVAYPYYAASFSMMGGFLLFSLVWLYHKDQPTNKKTN
jgi:oligosaccharyltransferase complex subunit beta